MKTKILILMLGFLVAFALTSKDVFGLYETTYPWTMQRYDLRRSAMTGSLAPSTNRTLWSQTYGSCIPVVVNGRVIITDSGYLYGLDETTGVTLWSPISFPSTLYGSPAVLGDRIYLVTSNGYAYCYNATNGAKIWERQATTSSIQTSPAVANGKVYFGATDSKLYALDANTGTILWAYTAGGAIYSSPAVDGDWLYFGCDNGQVRALNISGSGLPTLKWAYITKGQIHSTPCVAGAKVFFGSSSSDKALFAVDKITGQHLWKFKLQYGYETGSPAFAYGLVFFASGNKAYALFANATTGINYTEPDFTIQYWSETLGGYYPTDPIVADGKVFLCAGYTLYALNATSSGQVIWTHRFTYMPREPAIADGRIFICTSSNTYCFGNVFPPLTYYYTVTPVAGSTFVIQLVVNGTPSQIDISGLITQKRINYTVQGIPGTIGMSNITIPKAMLDGTTTVTVDGIAPNYQAPALDNGTHMILYFTYSHSGAQKIEIIGTSAIPELPSIVIMPLSATISLIAVALAKKRPPRNQVLFFFCPRSQSGDRSSPKADLLTHLEA